MAEKNEARINWQNAQIDVGSRPEGRPFWAGTKEGKFLLPAGPDGTPFWYPRAYAKGTLEDVSWQESKGEGTVYTYSVHYIGPPGFSKKGDPPHVIALVDLDEGVRVMTNLVKNEENFPDVDPDQIRIGQRVRVVFDELSEDYTLPRFTPVD
jgi:uncharacterized OB-fold protein